MEVCVHSSWSRSMVAVISQQAQEMGEVIMTILQRSHLRPRRGEIGRAHV